MKPTRLFQLSFAATALLSAAVLAAEAQQTVQPPRPAPGAAATARPAAPKTFASAQEAADALIDAAERFDVARLEQLFGKAGVDVILAGEPAQDRQRAEEFVAQARAKKTVSLDPANRRRAFLQVGTGEWPFPVPIVKRGTRWSFDINGGRKELLHRRIGANELDAIAICRGFVEAQHEYALQAREGHGVNQYAQRIVSTPGKKDGLAWQEADGSWKGPVGEEIAKAIEQGYTSRGEPFHGYFFKVLKGQGPAAPLGQMDFVVNGVMIGGFALVAAPARYAITGVQTFMVSHDGVVYQKDLGPATLDAFAKLDRFNPDKSWTPVPED
jgi:hypothetical protein